MAQVIDAAMFPTLLDIINGDPGAPPEDRPYLDGVDEIVEAELDDDGYFRVLAREFIGDAVKVLAFKFNDAEFLIKVVQPKGENGSGGAVNMAEAETDLDYDRAWQALDAV